MAVLALPLVAHSRYVPLKSRPLAWFDVAIMLGVILCVVFTFLTFVQQTLAAPNHARYAVASWYGPGLYGNKTANGTTLTPSTWGVAHKTLPFGTRLTICYRTKCAKVRVIDRGPHVYGRTFDLTAAVAGYLRLSGVQTVRWYYS